jgi:hypothetical protein
MMVTGTITDNTIVGSRLAGLASPRLVTVRHIGAPRRTPLSN